MNIDKKLLGDRIKSIRLSLGDNMREFGERLGSELRQASNLSNESNPSDSIVSRWEKGVSIPSPDRLKVIAELGETTVEDLLSRTTLENYTDKELLEELLRRHTMKFERKADL